MRKDRSATFLFEVRKTKNYEKVELPGFVFSVYDIDMEGNNQEQYRINGWSTAQYDDDLEMLIQDNKPSKCTDVGMEWGNCLWARATEQGNGCGKCEGGVWITLGFENE